ncbi:DDE_3 domain-containing protein [Trichonephila clavipes]|nr:DDE_3 domain-containing protein [Trichonephila clavipes]
MHGHTCLYDFERDTVTIVKHRVEVMEPYVHLFTSSVGSDFILMYDDAKPFGSHLVNEFLESEDIHQMDFPVKSPDLIRIEHIRVSQICVNMCVEHIRVPQRAIANHKLPPRTIQNFKAKLLSEWDQLPKKLINFLIYSIKSRPYICIRGPYSPLTKFFCSVLQLQFHTFRLR